MNSWEIRKLLVSQVHFRFYCVVLRVVVVRAKSKEEGPTLDTASFPQEVPHSFAGVIELIFWILRDVAKSNLAILYVVIEE